MLRYRFTAEEFPRMAEAGIRPEDARVEPMEGEIATLSPAGKGHMAAVKRLMDVRKAPSQVQDPLRLSPESEPQPGLALLSYRDKVPEEVWVVDLERDGVHVFRKPSREGYGERQTLEEGERDVLGLKIPVKEVLP